MNRSQSTKTRSKFLVDYLADETTRFRAEADSLWINVGQLVRAARFSRG